MKKKEKKKYDDDDGRTIADMSGVDHSSIFFPQISDTSDSRKEHQESRTDDNRQREDNSFSKEDRRAYILGALSAALLIAAIFIVVFGILIWLLLAMWS